MNDSVNYRRIDFLLEEQLVIRSKYADHFLDADNMYQLVLRQHAEISKTRKNNKAIIFEIDLIKKDEDYADLILLQRNLWLRLQLLLKFENR